MLHLDLDDVRVGMTLGEDVLGGKGQLLLGAGAALTGKHLETLRKNKVQRIAVQAGATAMPANSDLEPAPDDADVDARFRGCDPEHPLIKELRRLCRVRRENKGGTE